MTRQAIQRPEDSPQFGFTVTPGEAAMFEKIAREEAVHNELAANLSLYRDQIIQDRNRFVGELCKKYKIVNPAKVTFDAKTHRFVSVFSDQLAAFKINRRPRDIEQAASNLIFAAIREMHVIFKAMHAAGGQNVGKE